MHFLSIYCVTRTIRCSWFGIYTALRPVQGALQLNKNHIIRLYIKLLNMFNINPSSLVTGTSPLY